MKQLQECTLRILKGTPQVIPFIVCFMSMEWGASIAFAKTIGIKEVYEASVAKTFLVPIQELRKSQIEEQVAQAKGSILPNLALNSSYTKQDAISTGSTDNASSAIRNPDQYSTRVTLNQPLFRGLRDFTGVGIANTQLQAQESFVEQTKLNLYASAAQVYYSTLAAEQDILNLKNLSQLTQKRIQELVAQAKLGRSPKGDVLAAQSQLAIIQSQLDAAYAQRDQARTQFELVTGLPRDSDLSSVMDVFMNLKELEYFLKKMENRPDLQALQKQRDAAEMSVTLAKGEHLPSVDFAANYYLLRSGVLANSKWDIGVNLSFPLFQGGIVNSRVNQAAERTKEQELVVAQARREAEAQVITVYRQVKGGLDQLKSLSNALKIAEENYQVQSHDYRLGLVRNLEVLQALNSFQDLKRNLDRVRYQTLTAWAQLQAASNQVQIGS